MNANIIYSLGMTLLHSLWQVLLVYIILKILLVKLKYSSSRIRYKLSGIALAVSFLIAVTTFSLYFHNGKTTLQNTELILSSLDTDILSTYLGEYTKSSTSAGFQLYNFLPYLVIFYTAGVIILALRLTGSLLFLRKYRHSGIVSTDERLTQLFENLVARFSIKKKIRLIESIIAKSPMVIGYLKPVVIVPAGFFTQLPYNQVEAILAHELAHIKRSDFLINIIQSVVELLFFYHPVIYLISKHIREERENCCDDIAVEFCADSTQYIKALATMEGAIYKRSYPAVAFIEKKTNLLNRMKRLLKSKDMKTKNSDKIVAGSIILAGIFTILLTGAAALNNISRENSIALENEHQQSISLNNIYASESKADTIIDYDNNRVVTQRKNEKGENENIEMEFSDGKLVYLKVDGEVIPESRYKEYRTIVSDTKAEVKKAAAEVEKAERELEEIDEEEIQRQVEQALEEARAINQEEIEMELKKAQQELEKIDQEEIRAEVERALAEAERELEEAELDKVNMDSIRMEVDAAMNSIDWDEIHKSIKIAMEEGNISEEEMQKAMEEVNRAMEEIDWTEIQASIDEGLEAARISLEEIQWDVIMESVDISLDITADVIENIAKEIEISISELDEIDIDADISGAKEHVKTEKKKLNELEESMEKALEELEEK